jgi:hypothetical protein
MAHYDRMGLIWLLKGERVVALTAIGARLSGGLTFHRKGCRQESHTSRWHWKRQLPRGQSDQPGSGWRGPSLEVTVSSAVINRGQRAQPIHKGVKGRDGQAARPPMDQQSANPSAPAVRDVSWRRNQQERWGARCQARERRGSFPSVQRRCVGPRGVPHRPAHPVRELPIRLPCRHRRAVPEELREGALSPP